MSQEKYETCDGCQHPWHDTPCQVVVGKHNGYPADSGYRIDGEGPCACEEAY